MAFTYDKTQVTKREYNLYIGLTGGGITSFDQDEAISTTKAIKIGVLAEQPKITTDKGEDVPLNTGAKVVISENITFEAIVYEVTSANYEALRELITKEVDIFLTDGTAWSFASGVPTPTASSGAQAITISNMSIYPALEILGNGQNKITLSAEREAGVTDANVTITQLA